MKWLKSRRAKDVSTQVQYAAYSKYLPDHGHGAILQKYGVVLEDAIPAAVVPDADADADATTASNPFIVPYSEFAPMIKRVYDDATAMDRDHSRLVASWNGAYAVCKDGLFVRVVDEWVRVANVIHANSQIDFTQLYEAYVMPLVSPLKLNKQHYDFLRQRRLHRAIPEPLSMAGIKALKTHMDRLKTTMIVRAPAPAYEPVVKAPYGVRFDKGAAEKRLVNEDGANFAKIFEGDDGADSGDSGIGVDGELQSLANHFKVPLKDASLVKLFKDSIDKVIERAKQANKKVGASISIAYFILYMQIKQAKPKLDGSIVQDSDFDTLAKTVCTVFPDKTAEAKTDSMFALVKKWYDNIIKIHADLYDRVKNRSEFVSAAKTGVYTTIWPDFKPTQAKGSFAKSAERPKTCEDQVRLDKVPVYKQVLDSLKSKQKVVKEAVTTPLVKCSKQRAASALKHASIAVPKNYKDVPIEGVRDGMGGDLSCDIDGALKDEFHNVLNDGQGVSLALAKHVSRLMDGHVASNEIRELVLKASDDDIEPAYSGTLAFVTTHLCKIAAISEAAARCILFANCVKMMPGDVSLQNRAHLLTLAILLYLQECTASVAADIMSHWAKCVKDRLRCADVQGVKGAIESLRESRKMAAIEKANSLTNEEARMRSVLKTYGIAIPDRPAAAGGDRGGEDWRHDESENADADD